MAAGVITRSKPKSYASVWETQAEVARRCNVTQPWINDLLRGRVSRFSLDALVNIATALGCRVRVDLEAA
ncbi:MAG: XRE family transcriptional regulator [Bryobacteraceae bacterium]